MELYVQVRLRKSNEKCDDDGNGNADYEWYLIDDATLDGPLFPIHGMSQKLPNLAMHTTCLGSTIYVLESINNTTNTTQHNWKWNLKPIDPFPFDFWYMDVDTYLNDDGDIISKNSWIRGPSMLLGRPEGMVVAANGKIFVFADKKPHPKFWAQVFDVKSGKWSVLMPPQDLFLYGIPLVGGAVVLEDMDLDIPGDVPPIQRIKMKSLLMLLYLPELGCLCSYNMGTQKWEIFDSDFGSSWGPLTRLPGSSLLLAMNLNSYRMFGYHVGCKKWLHVVGLKRDLVLPPLDVLIHGRPRIHILSLGRSGELCLLWSTHSNISSNMDVFCTKFTICGRKDGCALVANVGPTKHFIVEDTDDWICCIALDPPRGSKRGGESSTEDEEQQKQMKNT